MRVDFTLNDTMARIFVYGDDGREIYQRNRDVTQDQVRARRNHTNLEVEVLKTEKLWAKANGYGGGS